MTPTFKYVEEYIEFIAGVRDAAGKALGLFDTVPHPISLARYDVAVVTSLGEQTGTMHNGYTDKQADLAVKIISKYRRQLAQLNPPVYLPEELNSFKYPLRKVDRTKSISLQDGHIVVKFPFDTSTIDAAKKQGKEGKGYAQFDYDSKQWNLALTESNLNWAVTIGKMKGFEIAPEINELYEKMLAAEQQQYSIELVETDTGFAITNAESSLIDYVNEHVGGFGPENFLKLADYSGVLGYTLSPELELRLSEEYGSMAKLILGRTHIKKIQNLTLESVLDYARTVNRLPVHIYDNGVPKPDTDEIVYLNKERSVNINAKLMVSRSSLMIGGRKESWRQNAEKVIIIE